MTFNLNTVYVTRRGDSLIFVRRTDKCIFDANGNKYKIHTLDGVEYIRPYGQHGGSLFAN